MAVLDLEADVQLQPADAGAVANQVVHKRNLLVLYAGKNNH